jgi:hypothetical protein
MNNGADIDAVLVGWLVPHPFELVCDVLAGIVRIAGLYALVWGLVAMVSSL